MQTDYGFFTVNALASMIERGKLIVDPIGQRPPVTDDPEKSIGIMESCLNGRGIGMMMLRDISQDEKAQKLYPGAKYTVIDGGHRGRAILKFVKNKLAVAVNGVKTTNLEMTDLDLLDNIKIPVDIRVCTTVEACELFRAVNTATPTNRVEQLMANEDSAAAEFVRRTTSFVKEYGNKPHPLFNVLYNSDGSRQAEHWFDAQPNPRRKWDEAIMIATVSLMKKEDDTVNWVDCVSFVEDDWEISNKVKGHLTRLLDDALELRLNRSKKLKLNTVTWDAFLTVWLGLYHYKSKEFRIHDHKKFAQNFISTYSMLTSPNPCKTDPSLDTRTIKDGKETHLLKEWMRSNIKKHFNNPARRKRVFDTFMQYFDDSCITYRTEQRSIATHVREEMLAQQGWVCAIDGLPLELDDSVWGHDTAWAHGGELMDGAVIRKSHNINMGTMTIDKYRTCLRAGIQFGENNS